MPPWQIKRALGRMRDEKEQRETLGKSFTPDLEKTKALEDVIKSLVADGQRWEDFTKLYTEVLTDKLLPMNNVLKCISDTILKGYSDKYESFVEGVFQNLGGKSEAPRAVLKNVTGVGVSLFVAAQCRNKVYLGYKILKCLHKFEMSYVELTSSPSFPKYELLYLAVEAAISQGDFDFANVVLNEFNWLVPEVGHKGERRFRERRGKCLQNLIEHFQEKAEDDQRIQEILSKILDTLLRTYNEDQDVVSEVIKDKDIQNLMNLLLKAVINSKNCMLAWLVTSLPAKYNLLQFVPERNLRQQLIYFVYKSSKDDARWLDKAGMLALDAAPSVKNPHRLYPIQTPSENVQNSHISLSPYMPDLDMALLIHGFMVKLLDRVLKSKLEGRMDHVEFRLEIELVRDDLSPNLGVVAHGSVLDAHERLRGVLKHQLKPPLEIFDANLDRFYIVNDSLKEYLQHVYNQRRSDEHAADTLFAAAGRGAAGPGGGEPGPGGDHAPRPPRNEDHPRRDSGDTSSRRPPHPSYAKWANRGGQRGSKQGWRGDWRLEGGWQGPGGRRGGYRSTQPRGPPQRMSPADRHPGSRAHRGQVDPRMSQRQRHEAGFSWPEMMMRNSRDKEQWHPGNSSQSDSMLMPPPPLPSRPHSASSQPPYRRPHER